MIGPCRFGRIHGKAIIGVGALLCFVFLLVAWNRELFASKNGVAEHKNALNPVNNNNLKPDERVGQKSPSTEKPPLDYEMIQNLARIGKPFGNSVSSTTQVPVQNYDRPKENVTRNEEADDRRKSKSAVNKSTDYNQKSKRFEKTIRKTPVENVVRNAPTNEETVTHPPEIPAQTVTLNDEIPHKSAVGKNVSPIDEVPHDLTPTIHPVENLIQIKNISRYFTGPEKPVQKTQFMSLVHSRDSHITGRPIIVSTQNPNKNLLPTEEVVAELIPTQTIVQDLTSTRRPVQILNPPPTQESTQNFYETEVPQNSDTKKDVLRKIEEQASQIVLKSADIAVEIWLNNGNLSYDDPLLVEYVGTSILIPPSIKSIPTKFAANNGNPSVGQIQAVWNILRDVTDGFYIDCGSNNGELSSNSLWLEQMKGWNGLIIEADPEKCSILRSKHRRSWHANVCLSKDNVPKMSSVLRNVKENGFDGLSNSGVFQEIKVKCIPIYTILLAMKRNVVDFFSLDMEGLELDVLKTIPFDKIKFKTLAITNWRTPGSGSVLKEFMEEKGYTLIEDIDTGSPQDSIIVLNSLLHGKSEQKKRNYESTTNTAISNKGSVSSHGQHSMSSKHKKNVFNLH